MLLKAAPSFLSSFHRLVVSVMHEGRQKGDRGTISFPPLLYIYTLEEEMLSRKKFSKPGCGIETVIPTCPLWTTGNELCGCRLRKVTGVLHADSVVFGE